MAAIGCLNRVHRQRPYGVGECFFSNRHVLSDFLVVGSGIQAPESQKIAPICPLGEQASTAGRIGFLHGPLAVRSEEHTSELQSLMRISYAVFCLKKKT